MLAALAFAWALAVPLSLAAWRLPRELDGTPVARPLDVHRRYRLIFWIAVPLLAAGCVWRFGATGAALAAIVCTLVLLTLAWIDAETGYLPDALTMPLLWLGLLVNLQGTFASLDHAVVGAVAGYLLLWCVYMVFLLLTGRQALGFGDLKLLAALGAWLGWMALPRMLIVAALLGLTVALVRRVSGKLAPGQAFSFGPYLAVAGVMGLLDLLD